MVNWVGDGFANAISEELEQKIRDFFATLDFDKPYEYKQAIMEYIPRLIYEHAQLCAYGSTYRYDCYCELKGSKYEAVPYMKETLSDIEKKIDYSCRLLFGEE